MKALYSWAMRLPSIRFCRLAILMVAAAIAGFYIGFTWSISCKFSSNLEECDKRTNDIDFLRESAKKLEDVALRLKISAGEGIDGGGGVGGDASRALEAVQRVIALLDPRQALSANDQSLRSAVSADACGEVYMGSMYDRPFFRKGFVPAKDCTHKPPLQELITVLLLAPPHKPQPGPPPDAPLTAVRAHHPQLLALAAVGPGHAMTTHPQTTVLAAPERKWAAPGALLNRLAAKARTPYVLVTRDAVRVDELARLERLIYVVSVLGANFSDSARRSNDSGVAWGVAVAGGAVRDSLGRWSAGCAETRLRNYALRVRRGYRYSALDCMLCDSLRGPFVARTALLREVAFDERLPAAVVFEDWFLRVKRRGALAAVCPDALFFVSGAAEGEGEDGLSGGVGGRAGREAWRLLAAAWQVDTVHLPGRPPLRFSCEETYLPCDLRQLHKKGLLIPNCCLKEVAGALAAYEDFATRHNLEYELNEGTALGAAKLQSVLPWDIDGDILIHIDDFEKYKAKKKEMADLGYAFKSFTQDKGFTYFSFATPNVNIDMWCRKKMSNFLLPKEMQKYPTRMKIMGVWMRGPWNPGLLVRNRYGPGYLKHAQHWTKLGMQNHNEAYSVGSWSNCSLPNHHACLNRYPAEGSFNVLPEYCP